MPRGKPNHPDGRCPRGSRRQAPLEAQTCMPKYGPMSETAYKRSQRNKRASQPRIIAGRLNKKRKLVGSGDYSYNYVGDTPYASVGKHLGSMVGAGYWGEMLGHGIGRILGSGDYETGPMVKQNPLVNTSDVPQFAASGRANVVAHRDFLGDVITSGSANTFKLQSYVVNAGNRTTFPWLSTVAQNYEQYRLLGVVFMFKSTSGDSVGSVNTSLGTVILSTDYNVSSPNYKNKIEMENAEFAISAKASISQMHAIECDVSDRPVSNYFVRTGALPTGQDPKWYDFCNFQIATTGFQGTSVNVGELWVTYAVEFLKPVIPETFGGKIATATVVRNGCSFVTGWFGTATTSAKGSISASFPTGNSVSWDNAGPGAVFLVSLEATEAGTYTAATVTSVTGGALVGISFGNAGLYAGPATNLVANPTIQHFNVQVDESNITGVVTLTLANPGISNIGPDLKVLITQLDESLLA